VSVDSSKSSQFASALLLTLPTLESPSTLNLLGDLVSMPYLDATLAVLRFHRVQVRRRGRRFDIPGGQRIHGDSFDVPGDASSAAYLWAAAAVGGGSVRVDGVDRKWPQADLLVLDLLEKSGASVSRKERGAEVSRGKLVPFRVDLTDAPDLYPLAGVVAATIPGTSRLAGAEHVALKESDRRSSTALLARSMGARVEEGPFGLRITGTSRPRAFRLTTLTDHRLVMSAAVGALAAEGESTIGEREAVRKSFPGFWDALGKISGGVE
jgi:3-phosphoshikimate 1-carboxyvinyltransferase